MKHDYWTVGNVRELDGWHICHQSYCMPGVSMALVRKHLRPGVVSHEVVTVFIKHSTENIPTQVPEL